MIIATILWLKIGLENNDEDITIGTLTAAIMWGLTSWGSVFFFSTIPIMMVLGKLAEWYETFTNITIIRRIKKKGNEENNLDCL